MLFMVVISPKTFLSTLSLRRATLCDRAVHQVNQHLYPRSPCGERQYTHFRPVLLGQISIHALLAESDARIIDPTYRQEVFLSTLSLRRATNGSDQN